MAVIKGKPVADSITATINKKTEELKNNGIVPLLTIVRVGERGDDIAYERAAVKRMDMPISSRFRKKKLWCSMYFRRSFPPGDTMQQPDD